MNTTINHSNEPVRDLSGCPAKSAQMWGLARQKGVSVGALDVTGRCVVFGHGGQSTTIVAYDPHSKRVQTTSGAVYQLEMPNVGFAMQNPRFMEILGFGN
ncbi:hypothetical protein A8H39_00490 [Paraburkholderia fungorum]|uniref:hypothetical protein n=1 Tax=Paraburkholderia fungorum TaxID=134537 RepID=UPI000486CAF0|nr:hypothetical protein [Paraburkholderia fungorum]MBB5547730.1 hypothetical protein [Paraburkholderia fungorum]PNE59662.1 hypothetical protein A8H39_00490 [Paraburkholderia fungorum]